MNLNKTVHHLKKGVMMHSPELLTGIGIAGMVTSTILAVKATPKALYLLDESKKKCTDEKELKKSILLNVAPVYIPSLITAGFSIVCLVSSTKISTSKSTALAAAYSLSESALQEYQKKVIETIGEEKESDIRDAIIKDRMYENPPAISQVYVAKADKTIFMDSFSGRTFESDIETVRKIENRLNKELLSNDEVSLNAMWYEIGLACTPAGNDRGWKLDNGLIEFRYSAQLYDDIPIIVLDYHTVIL